MPHKSAYNSAVELRLSGALDADALAASVHAIARRHESLRTTFEVRSGTVEQLIWPELAPDVATLDVSSSPDPEAAAARAASAVAEAPFDLRRGPLLRVRVIRVGPVEHALVLVVDHIVADGMSLGILWRELGALYRALVERAPSPLGPPKQYAACVEAQNDFLRTGAFAQQLARVTKRLADATACEIPGDRPHPPARSYRGGLVEDALPAPLTARIRALAMAEEVSVFTLMLAGLDVVFARSSGQREVLLMVPAACRQRFDASEVVGFFANMVVLRTEVAGAVAYRELLRRVNREVLVAVWSQEVPFEKVVQALRPERSLRHDPLANIAVGFLPAQGSTLDLPGIKTTRFRHLSNGGSKFDLHFMLAEHADHLSVSVEYNLDVYDRETVEALLARYRTLLDAAIEAPDTAVEALPILAPEERHRVVTEWNATRANYARHAALPALFAATAAAFPNAAAVSFEGCAMSYGELDRRSNQLARALAARGVGAGAFVGVAVERSNAMVVALLGILKAGAAYVPLDPAYPRDRLTFMASDAGLRLLVTEDHLASLVPAPPGGLLLVDGDETEINAQSPAPLPGAISAESPAYVLYTSGSTGKPKGVIVPHRALVNFVSSMAKAPGLSPSDRLLGVTSLSFDIAGLELWLPLTVGAHVVIASRATASDGEALRGVLESGGITVVQATPSTFRMLLEAGWQRTAGLRVLVGGEAPSRDLVAALCERADEVWNMYGPTETTIWSCIQRLGRDAPVLVGRPIANTQVYVLDAKLAPMPPGATGEVFIGGDGVALGYLGRPDLTAERFVADPFSARAGDRLYRTGDLGRQRRDGALELLGRADQQVKIRGHRIELGEIEAALCDHEAVREAVVVLYEEAPGHVTLVAHVAARTNNGALGAALRSHLRARLPEFMVPAQLLVQGALPRTANGKIDRRALPAPTTAPLAYASATDASPREALEFKLRGVWEEVLGAKNIGIHESFFDLGGHSLLALKLIDRIDRAFGQRLPVATIFTAPTIARMGEILRVRGWKPAWTSLVPIQPGGSRPPFFCVHGGGAHVVFYYPLAKRLGPDQPVYGLQPRALSIHDPDDPHVRSVEAMAAHYLEELREIQPAGPYLIGGASYGGTIALEMAQQLRAAGERIALLCMFDTYGPGYRAPPTGLRRALYAPVEAYLRVEHHVGSIFMLPTEERAAYARSKLQKALTEGGEVLETYRRHVARGVFTRIGRSIPEELEAVRNLVNEAVARYVPRAYEGRITLFRARRQAPGAADDPTLGWGPIALGGLEIHGMPGYHASMISEPRVRLLATELERCIARASAKPTGAATFE
jgi:amino acid adenylation domain-containing protein